MNLYTSILICFCLLSMQAFAIEVHVSPKGDDANAGTQGAPLATLQAARDALRKSGRIGKEPCSVIIHEGFYRLIEPLRFGPQDGGSEDSPVIYRAAAGAKVVVTGAQIIEGEWESWKNDIFRIQVGDLDAVDQLFVNGSRQVLARYPNLGAGFVTERKDKAVPGKAAGNVPYDGSDPDAWGAKKALSWGDPTGAFLHGMHSGLWGSQHYRVIGKKSDGSLSYEGGWQNNRHSPPHEGYRMVENIFEELDAPDEWYHDTRGGWLYYKPAENLDLASAKFEVILQIKHLVEFYGAVKSPVATMEIMDSGNGLPKTVVDTYETTEPIRNMRLEGIHFRGTARTFMATIEPLLRSDWSVYRGGAIHLRGTKAIEIEKCTFEELGGNAIFVDGYNRGTVIRGNRFRDNGATDVNFVGSFSAVRNPSFNFGAPAYPLDEIDTEIGPKTDEYPADCLVEDNLMTRCGRFEKQTAGVNLSMSSRITIRHNTISHTPRAAINICDGTWGGHLIEWNDCFETVLETHDHGALNAWGRDRIWHSASPAGPNERDETGKALISYFVEKYPNSPRWDAYQTTIIRNNRMHCEHGWDIDLDDGCTNYEIYNNLSLSGGLKTREGYYRTVTNNVIIGGYTCNVPYPKPTYDIFERNILLGTRIYSSSSPALWGGTRNHNFVHNPTVTETIAAVGLQDETGDDAGSLYGNAHFIAPEQGDFSVASDSPALEVRFENFPMEGFGVTSPNLKQLAGSPPIEMPESAAQNVYNRPKETKLLGATVKNLDTEAEVTATGMQDRIGVYCIDVPAASELGKYGFKSGDVILFMNGSFTSGVNTLKRELSKLKSGEHEAKIWRAQEDIILTFNK
ncbi:right-handed parallel beta-helix repeat-containing protein [Formosa sp. PL04]|uniref:right-handed parallel beta-helix repeat-containing protein n=1 Tax=Formosa sp. PL04 TaxID=3081755 RepID=UPI002981D265|nr:right-handed parallel beta-helix repeat-containing protein [Formosa sp. PL04]MDW5290108.1 right-handed parallel beta-helix repeat-containing protein [Formosa sp. PL04]